ncbi:MAG TPA: HD domain-containing phosphohydrolase [Candidatus Rifleibacterium sp.]|nr:HD domain-containing phosphohydrolase [Candidatus Rifleibacterium sp.]
MQPLELSCITGIWKTVLSRLDDTMAGIGSDLQLWFPWSGIWRGHDRNGSLPPTDFPDDLAKPGVSRFGGRFWKAFPVNSTNWLVSVRAANSAAPEMSTWELPAPVAESLHVLSDFVRLECLLGLTMKILENQSREHTGHWDRVRNLSVAIGSEMGLSTRELADLEMAAMLHDIGKVGLPEELLQLSGPLSPDERSRIESHSLIGSAMIREIPGMEMVAEIVLGHHEAIDGSGYPRGLKFDEIPFGSLIIAVADAFDAMTHYRPYAIERTYHESFEEIRRETGKYAPEVLAALERVLRRLGILDAKPLVGTTADW